MPTWKALGASREVGEAGRAVSRRDALRFGGAAAMSVAALSGCGLLSTEPEKKDGSKNDPKAGGKEAPMLASMVESGDLPPVKERLPKNPLQIEPLEEVGQYGGTWRTALSGASDGAWLDKTVLYDHLVRWTPEWDGVIPNFAESFDVLEDGKVFQFTLREGAKWSDGEPFTTADVEFAYNDVILNEELSPEGAPSYFTSDDGEPATLEVDDEWTFRLVFTSPQGLFLEEMCTPNGRHFTTRPRHYLEEFHADYNDDIESLVSEGGYESWVDLYLEKGDYRGNSDLPCVSAWMLTTALGAGNPVVAERNPYYWKVDTEGRQLPYIDKVTYNVIEDSEVLLLKASSGEFDMHTRHILDLENKPVLAEGREDGNYKFIDMTPSLMNEMMIFLNLTHENPVLREVFGEKDFRIGLSHAINRQNLIDAVFQRQGEPWQGAPRRESDLFNEELAKQYTEYDVDLANEHLDKAGFDKRDKEGFRLGPDGKRIMFRIDVVEPTLKASWVDAMDFVRQDWEEVGIKAAVNPQERTLWVERMEANQHDAGVWQGDGGLQDAIPYGFYYLPFHSGFRAGIRWYDWYASGGEEGEEPPGPAKRQLELYDQVLATIDKDEQLALYAEILEIAKEQFWCIGTVQMAEEFAIVNNNMRNVMDGMPNGYLYPTPAPTNPEQYFFTDS